MSAAPRGGLLARNTVINVVGQGAPILVALLALPYVVGGLGEERFGVLALAWAALGFFGVLDLGLGKATTKFVAEALGRGATAEVAPLLGTATLVQAVFGLVGAVVLALAAPWLAERAFEVPPALVAETRGALYVIALALPVVVLSGSIRGALAAAQRFDLINLVTVPATSATFLLPVLGVALDWGLPAIVALLLAGRVTALVALAWMTWRHVPGLPARLSWDRTTLRRMFGFGGWVMASNLTIPLFSHVERFLIPALLGMAALTYYSVPFEMLVRIGIIPASMALTLFPAFSYHHGGDGALDELFGRPLKYLLLIMTPLLAGVATFAHDLLAVWLGAEFAAQAAPTLQILAAAFYLNAFAQVPFVTVQGLGRPDLKAKLDLVQVPLFIVLVFVLVPRWGIAGAAAAKLAVTALDTTMLFWFAGRIMGSRAGERFPEPLRRAVALSAGLLAVAAALLVAGLPGALPYGAFALAAAAFVLAFTRVCLDGTDRAALGRVVARVVRTPAAR